jgi:hypothetical protein
MICEPRWVTGTSGIVLRARLHFATVLDKERRVIQRQLTERPSFAANLPNLRASKWRPLMGAKPAHLVACVGLLSLACETGSAQDHTDATTSGSNSELLSSGTSATTSRTQPSYDTAYDTAPLFTGQPPVLSATIAETSGPPDVSNAPLQTCTPATGPGQDLVIDDFEDQDLELPRQEGRRGQWYAYEEVSGDHQLTIAELQTPRLQSHVGAHTSSSGHGEWAGFGVQLSSCVYDASAYVGLHFWIRGTSNPINVSILTPGVVPVSDGGPCVADATAECWDAYRVTVELTEEWREYFFPFDEFKQNGYGQDAGPLDLTRVRSVEFQSIAGAFEYWVDDLSFYIDEVYTPLDPGTDGTDSGSNDASSSGDTSSGDDVTTGDAGAESSGSGSTNESETPTSEVTSEAASAADGGVL